MQDVEDEDDPRDPLQDGRAAAAAAAAAADKDDPRDPLQDVEDEDDPHDPLQDVEDDPSDEDAPLPLPSEKPVNPNSMMATAMQFYLRTAHQKKEEAAEGVVPKKKVKKPKPVKAKVDMDAMKARYLKRMNAKR